jgi:hypothetical protein
MSKRTVEVLVKVEVPAGLKVSDIKVAELVGKMLDIGYADAAETNEDPDIDNPEAAIVEKLSFGKPSVKK